MESLREFLRISLKIQPWKLGRQGRRRAQRQKRRTPCQKNSLNNINKINYHTLTMCYVLALAGCVCVCVRVRVKLLRSQLTLCNPMDCSPPGSSVHGVLQARTLEWVAISFCNAWKWKVKVKSLSCVRLFSTPWTAAYQVPPSMGFSRQEYWSGMPLPSLILKSSYLQNWSPNI